MYKIEDLHASLLSGSDNMRGCLPWKQTSLRVGDFSPLYRYKVAGQQNLAWIFYFKQAWQQLAVIKKTKLFIRALLISRPGDPFKI